MLNAKIFVAQEVNTLWSQWKPTDAELALWVEKISRCDEGIFRRAVRDFRASSANRSNTPDLGKIIDLYWKYWRAEKQTKPDDRPKGPSLNYTLQCYEHLNPMMIGRTKAFFSGKHKDFLDPDRLMEAAEKDKEGVQSLYGGFWRIIRAEEEVTPIRRIISKPVPVVPVVEEVAGDGLSF